MAAISIDFSKVLENTSVKMEFLFYAALLDSPKQVIHDFYRYWSDHTKNALLSLEVQNINQKIVKKIVRYLEEIIPSTIDEQIQFLQDYVDVPCFEQIWNFVALSYVESKDYSALYTCLEFLENVFPTKSELFLRKHNLLPALTKDYFESVGLERRPYADNGSCQISTIVWERWRDLSRYLSSCDKEYIRFLTRYLTEFDYPSFPEWSEIIPPSIDDVVDWACISNSHQRVLHWELLEKHYPGIRALYDLCAFKETDGAAFGKQFQQLIDMVSRQSLEPLDHGALSHELQVTV